ncbi:hypothetical protein N2152v2_009670 [Parachlorella kessleri]
MLSVKDRVRALAVCQAWKEHLDPTKRPLDGLELVGSQEAHLRIAGWIRATQPALKAFSINYFDQPQLLVTLSSVGVRTALTELSLSGEAADILDSLVPVCLFRKLRCLSLACRYPPEDDFEGRLDFAALQPLSALEHLRCCSWPLGELRGGTLLPKLTFLHFKNGGSWAVDAVLPSLQVLWFDCASIRLAGEHLQLPCLTALGLFYGDAAVQWPAMPQLAALTAEIGSLEELSIICYSAADLTVEHLGWLCSLTSLRRLGFGRKLVAGSAAGRLIQHASSHAWLTSAAPGSVRQPHILKHLSWLLQLVKKVRALAVCRAWRSSLDPKAWPIESLDFGESADRPIADWVINTRPAVRSVELVDFQSWEFGTLLSVSPRTVLTELSLLSDTASVLDILTPVCRFFPGLKALSLDLAVPDSQAELDLAVLQPLTCLQRLSCASWKLIVLRTSTALLQLTHLKFSEVEFIHIDAALPSLQLLAVDTADKLIMAGDGDLEKLHLPQLSELRLSDIDSIGSIGLHAAPQLAIFDARDFVELGTYRMAELRHLTSLILHCRWGSIDSALELVPPTLLHLEVVGLSHDCLQPPAFHRVPRLTSLTCDKLTIIPYLDSLPNLQHLEFPTHSASDLTLEHIEWLCDLTSLQRLHFGAEVKEGSAGRRRLKALADLSLYGQASLLLDALPAVCLFTRLNALSLLACPTFVGTLYLAALRPLSSLQNLVCEGWDRVELRASAVLPQLTSMESLDVEHVVLDAALPSLQRLNIIGGEVDLAGERLLLPQLSQLSLELAYVETADWHATPQLAKLSVVNCGTVTAGLTALARLTSLTLDWSHEVWDEDLWVQSRDLCHSLLQAAPPSVRHLHLGGPQDYSWLRVPALASVPHITSLSCRSPAIIIMAGLGPLTQLQHLEFPDSSVLALSVEHLEVLYRLTTLRRLVFGIPLDASSVGHRLQVRALAVCRAWRSSLDPKAWPVESLELGDGEGEDRPITDWVISTQPAVRSVDLVGFRSWEFGTLLSISPRTGLTELSLLSDSAPMLDLLAPVCRFFPGLKALSLDLTVPDSQAELDLAVLQPLTRLQRLRCSEWPDVTLKSTAVLLQLTQLAFIEVAVIRIDAALPSLKLLAVDAADTFVLSGDPGAAEQLDLPQLSDFRLADIGSAAIGLEAAPQLARFDAREFGELAVSGMAELRHLTSLVLHCRWGSIDHALEVAPPTLLHLEVVRARAVCRAWNAYLDPKLWPIVELSLNGSEEADRRIASWISTTQPALRRLDLSSFFPGLLCVTLSSVTPRTAMTELSLSGQADFVQGALTAVCLFARLKILSLSAHTLQEVLDLSALQPLTALERLRCEGWEDIVLRASTVL